MVITAATVTALHLFTWNWRTEIKLLFVAGMILIGVLIWKERKQINEITEEILGLDLPARREECRKAYAATRTRYLNAMPIYNFMR